VPLSGRVIFAQRYGKYAGLAHLQDSIESLIAEICLSSLVLLMRPRHMRACAPLKLGISALRWRQLPAYPRIIFPSSGSI